MAYEGRQRQLGMVVRCRVDFAKGWAHLDLCWAMTWHARWAGGQCVSGG